MKRTLWIVGSGVLLVVIIVGAILVVRPFGGQGNAATVVEVLNTVDAHANPRDDWRPAEVGMNIHPGGQVRTGAQSLAQLELLEGMVRLSANSIFTVRESLTRQEVLVTRLFLQEGRLWAHLTTDQPHQFSVETGSAVAAVRDTRFSVRVAEGETLLSVAEGQVDLTAQGRSVTVVQQEQVTVEPGQPPSPPEPMSDQERALWASEGQMPGLAPPTPTPVPPTPTSTPLPVGELDTGMGGSLSIRGVVRDSSGRVASDVYVTLTVYEAGGGGDQGQLGAGEVYTDEAGRYAFNNLIRVEGGHYEVWFNGRQEYGRVYENKGYHINADEISGDSYSMDVTVHPVTGSALSAGIQYEDADGTIKNYLDTPLGPDHFVDLHRESDDKRAYPIGFEYLSHDGSRVYLNGLAGGTYYLIFQYRRSDGTWVAGRTPSFEIAPGETRRFDYTIPLKH
jgi:hypothetical protein